MGKGITFIMGQGTQIQVPFPVHLLSVVGKVLPCCTTRGLFSHFDCHERLAL